MKLSRAEMDLIENGLRIAANDRHRLTKSIREIYDHQMDSDTSKRVDDLIQKMLQFDALAERFKKQRANLKPVKS